MNHSFPVIEAPAAPPWGSTSAEIPGTPLTADAARGPLFHALLTLPARENRVRATREFTSSILDRWNIASDDRDSAILIVSELTANAARYGRAEMTVRLALGDRTLHIAVADTGLRPSPSEKPDIDTAEHGRGLGIVEFLAHWVGVREESDGRWVHVDLSLAVQDNQPEL
ncbi:ATP-binding protein [Streptomyces sp. SRF1]|uniref:ATP-binding protein n=1 Tax=Streptomyces sp. SRF1 TaxID=1549642 RepID=UPI0025B27DCE|nr:ATP-binding protein [Streptomyces sp. SRF1]MDN3060032.1 ATP-binding protein [Streptomyces sp. SRF1]